MTTPSSDAVSVTRGELRSRTELVLEAIALRHQIAVLKRSGTRRPCFRGWDRLLLGLAVVVVATLAAGPDGIAAIDMFVVASASFRRGMVQNVRWPMAAVCLVTPA
jgi:hypothetical protein